VPERVRLPERATAIGRNIASRRPRRHRESAATTNRQE
jgi:hypothetical protein